MPNRLRVCFVCLGNICRSPTAEGVFRKLVEEAGLSHRIEVESAGTAAYHVGESPDPRSREAARERGVRVGGSARQFTASDFTHFDYVLAMDGENEDDLRALAGPGGEPGKVFRLRRFDPRAKGRALDVPDPYYGEGDGFERVLDICEVACRGLLAHLVAEHELG